MATTYSYALERVYECLVSGAGARNALSASQRFVRGFPPGVPPTAHAERSLAKPSCYVTVADQQSDPFASGENNASHLYRVTLHLWRYYYVGHSEDTVELDAQQVRAIDDFPRVRAVLCWPGNLQTTAGGNATGLDGQSLDGYSARAELQRETSLGGTDRLLQYRDTFTAAFAFEPTP